eukprot:TRINITY_DN5824_c0_g1_i1.p1 TRINITY_DN5824_c0_g1~~TRINITY_DN5824_c0_g1_i1.p1  ORF type:complete len:359 (+),score=56.82 TRINITY_DN5824_c0_g1_i1:699-1775(+)
MIYNFIACCAKSNYLLYHNHEEYKNKSGVIYSPGYNITFCGLEKCHPFDSTKYGRCFSFLHQQNVLREHTQIHSPDICPRALLLDLNLFYLLSHCYALFMCTYLEIPLFFLPGFLFRFKVLNPMLRATMGTIEGCCIALEKGWAINLSGGYHHARRGWGGGFCVYPDITLAITHLRRWHTNIKKVMIIDCDAHQGNGYERDFMDDNDVYILDVYHHHIYPGDDYAALKISQDVSVTSEDNSGSYLDKLDAALTIAFRNFSEVDFVIYNAGTDILEGDPLGRLNITEAGVIGRDELVFKKAFDRKIPILMVLSGGYQHINAQVIANSIENLFHKYPYICLLYTSPSPRDATLSRMPSSA